MHLDELMATVLREPASTGISRADSAVTSVECDSRRVAEGSVFVAIRGGQEQDRHQFVADAIVRGASAVIVEDDEGLADTAGASVVKVANCRVALAELSARFNDYPAASLRCIGVTGTNGKTTTALLVRQILSAAGLSCGYAGTLGAAIEGDDVNDETLSNTTPEAPELHGVLRRMVAAGRSEVVLEVSSHALALDRTRGIDFDSAVFTNLTRDHLDFHGSEAAYMEAKSRIFEQLRDDGKAKAIVNRDDPVSALLHERLDAPCLTFGRHADSAVRLVEATYHPHGSALRVQTQRGQIELQSQLTGGFNCSNILAAVACALGLGVDEEAIRRGVRNLERVPGRLESIDEGQDFQVLVDYAHTPAGLETVLKTAREFTEQRLICLFGCGGDRDVGKRPLMGKVASEQADLLVLTSDNPRTESPDRIIADISTAVSTAVSAVVCPDRREAIFHAIDLARGGDTIVIAGKGDEGQQIFADRAVDLDDRVVAREALRQLFQRRD